MPCGLKSESLDDSGSIVHTYGESTSVILLKISSARESVYDFLDVTEANVAYWQGHQTTAVCTRSVDLLPSGVTPSHVSLSTVFSDFASR